MKKCLIGFIIALISIIPISEIKAYDYELNNGSVVSLADLPNDGNNEFIILKNQNGYYHMYSYNSDIYSDVEFVLRHGLSNVFYFKFTDSVTFNFYYYSSSSNSWKFNKENDTCVSSCYFDTSDQSYVQVIYSTQDLKFEHEYQSYYTFIDNSNFDVNTWEANDVVYYSDVSKNEYLTMTYELYNNEYYNIWFISNNYNSSYTYKIKFDNEGWINITNSINNSYYTYRLLYNSTLYMVVLNENNEYVEIKTMTFTELLDKEAFYSPTIDINVGCVTDYNTNIEKANINLNFNNYSFVYKYQYSFNGIDYFDISNSDIINKKYSLSTYVNTSFYVRILDLDNNVVFSDSKNINCILDSDNYYYYELTIDDLYSSETNQLIYYTFYYENMKRDFTPFIYFYSYGSDKLDFHITYNTGATNFDMHYDLLLDKTLEDLPCTSLPFEYVENLLISNNNYTTYTIFSFMPCIDLSTFLYGEHYIDFKLVVKSNVKLDIGKPIYFGGAFYPSTNKPLDNSSSFQSNYVSFFEKFNNAFNNFKGVIIEIFQNCTYLFNSLNVILQDFFIVIFVLILFIFLIRFIL